MGTYNIYFRSSYLISWILRLIANKEKLKTPSKKKVFLIYINVIFKKHMREKWVKIKIFIDKHERVFLPLFLFLGFIVDSLTLTRVDRVFDNVLLLFYIILAATTIILSYSQEKLYYYKFYIKYKRWLPYLMQYAFGGLFSGLVIFYSMSASIFTSFPFLLILVTLMIGNEFFNKKWPKITFQILMFYIALLSYCILIVPIIFNTISVWTFLLGAVISLLLMIVYIGLFSSFIPKAFKPHKQRVTSIIVSVFIVFNVMYFANIIPPIPLSLKDGGIYHSIVRNDTGEYIVKTEDKPWYSFFKSYNPTFNKTAGETVYAFSSVYAPANFNNTIYHEWSYYNTQNKKWVATDKIPIRLTGGRDAGFRGYSFKSSIDQGLWRVRIITESNQVVGRLNFDVRTVREMPELTREVF